MVSQNCHFSSASWQQQRYAPNGVPGLAQVAGGADGHPVTPALVACISPYIRDHIRRFGRFALDMAELPTPLNPQPLPFENAL
jgi:hypothetical protein